jgi:methyl-accepting chemotaxis protein
MNLDDASRAHSDWRIKLRTAIAKKEPIDVRTIGADNCCALGQWLHGEGKSSYSRLRAYSDCVDRHAAFHRAARGVADAINQKRYADAEAMLGSGTPYAQASSAVGSALLGLKKELAAA